MSSNAGLITVDEQPCDGNTNKNMILGNELAIVDEQPCDGNIDEDIIEDTKEYSQLKGINDEMIPRIGMVFETPDSAYNFYLQYAYFIGFGITKKKTAFNSDRKLERMYIACVKWGKGRDNPRYKARLTASTNCGAFIRVSLFGDGLYHITALNLEHNHMCSPSKSRHYRCHKSLPYAVKKQLECNKDAGVRVCKSFQAVVDEQTQPASQTTCSHDSYFAAFDSRLGALESRRTSQFAAISEHFQSLTAKVDCMHQELRIALNYLFGRGHDATDVPPSE